MTRRRPHPTRCPHWRVARGPRRQWACRACGERFTLGWRLTIAETDLADAVRAIERLRHNMTASQQFDQAAWADVLRVFGLRKRQHLVDVGHALQAQARRGAA